MSVISKKTFIAIEAVLYIARNASASPVRSKEICEYQGIKLRYLEHIMQNLVTHNVLKGIRGPSGGYVLARDRRKISLAAIYDAMRELENNSSMVESNSLLSKKVMEPIWVGLKTHVRTHLELITVQDVYNDSVENIGTDSDKKADFII